MRECGVLFRNDLGGGPEDETGCRLPHGHDGPHEFADPRGNVWQWETDWSCDCEHCRQCEGDYCEIYWPKKRPTAATEGRNLCGRTASATTQGNEILMDIYHAAGGQDE